MSQDKLRFMFDWSLSVRVTRAEAGKLELFSASACTSAAVGMPASARPELFHLLVPAAAW
jgi:hypothetical protein